jgi:hypothetical protein
MDMLFYIHSVSLLYDGVGTYPKPLFLAKLGLDIIDLLATNV